MAKATAEEKTSAATYTKEQLIRSSRYMNRRDLLGVILKNEKRYTLEEVDIAIENYMKGKVK